MIFIAYKPEAYSRRYEESYPADFRVEISSDINVIKEEASACLTYNNLLSGGDDPYEFYIIDNEQIVIRVTGVAFAYDWREATDNDLEKEKVYEEIYADIVKAGQEATEKAKEQSRLQKIADAKAHELYEINKEKRQLAELKKKYES